MAPQSDSNLSDAIPYFYMCALLCLTIASFKNNIPSAGKKKTTDTSHNLAHSTCLDYLPPEYIYETKRLGYLHTDFVPVNPRAHV